MNIPGFLWDDIVARGVDRGNGVQTWPIRANGENIIGFIEWHLNQQGEPCGGYVGWAPSTFEHEHPDRMAESEKSRPRWTLVKPEPELTLSPSILCKACGQHGYIRDGKWVVA